MVSVASQPPACFLAGYTEDNNFQPLNDCGAGNPFFYHQFADDLDAKINFTSGNVYTLSGTSATFVQLAGPGGLGVLSTEAVANQIAQIQLVTAGFTQNIAPKKLFYLTRVTANTNAASSKWLFGVVNAGAAITAASGAVAATDGIYFLYVGSSGTLTLNQAVGGTVTSVTIPAAAYSIGSSFDLAFYQNRSGDILAFIDTQLVGFVPQSNLGTPNNPQNSGPVARILGTSYTATSVNLAPTVCAWESNGTASTLTLDFLLASQER